MNKYEALNFLEFPVTRELWFVRCSDDAIMSQVFHWQTLDQSRNFFSLNFFTTVFSLVLLSLLSSLSSSSSYSSPFILLFVLLLPLQIKMASKLKPLLREHSHDGIAPKINISYHNLSSDSDPSLCPHSDRSERVLFLFLFYFSSRNRQWRLKPPEWRSRKKFSIYNCFITLYVVVIKNVVLDCGGRKTI